jgi:hypothetical protein
MASPLSRDEFAAAFGTDPLRLPDVVARGSSRADWPRIADAVDGLGWASGAIREFATPSAELRTTSVIPIEGVTINFFEGDEVAFDFDLSEMSTQAAVDAVCTLAITIGRATDRVVSFVPEGDQDAAITYDPANDAFAIT